MSKVHIVYLGFAAKLTEDQAQKLAEFPGVVRVIPNSLHRLQTTRSWDFLGLPSHSPSNVLHSSSMGDGVIIGVLDTGIWPESKAFSDVGLEPIPSRWKDVDERDGIATGSFHAVARGITVVCGAANDGPSEQTVQNTAPWILTVAASTMDRAFPTPIVLGNNRTVVGQALYTGQEVGFTGLVYPEATGFDPNASGVYQIDYEVGTQILFYIRSSRSPLVKLSPSRTLVGKPLLAKVAFFSSRGPNSLAPAILKPDIAAPGVNILAATSPLNPLSDNGYAMFSGTSMATPHVSGIVALIKALHPNWSPAAIKSALVTTARRNGPSGNDGPISQTISNTAPWLITVGATAIDRAFPTAITLGNNQTLWGLSIDTIKENRGFTGLTYSKRIAADNADNSAEDCQLGSLNATLAAGKIILCFSKSATHKIGTAEVSVQRAGGVGLIFAQYRANGLEPCFLIPCIKVDYEVGTQILSYIRKASSPIAKLGFPKTVIGKWVSPKVASFSSRGPSSMSPSVLKPDIVAPGVDILAAYSPVGAKDSTIEYALQSGTSMACPHVAGIAALIKSVHKDWSPAAIRSALVTTASQFGTDGMNIFEEGPTHKEADPFDMGGGHVNPNKAMNPGNCT
ncbi:hypothetical protein Q3G72_035129 [Acer saccharum]|nr:hypothetical protein Q3G72_035129 [Acer saccharum]